MLSARIKSLVKKQQVPPYVIFHDKTLTEISCFRASAYKHSLCKEPVIGYAPA